MVCFMGEKDDYVLANLSNLERLAEIHKIWYLSMISNKEKEFAEYFKQAESRILCWLLAKPSGEFSIKGFVNQGGLRGKPEISITEKIKK